MLLTDKKFLKKIFIYFSIIFAYFILINYLKSYFNPFESIIGLFAFLGSSLIKFVFFLLLLIYIFRFLSDRNKKNKELLLSSFLAIVLVFLSSYLSTQLAIRFFPNYMTKVNEERNREKIDINIPQEETQEIRELAKTISQENEKILRVSDCQREKDFYQKVPSKLCQKGDLILKLGWEMYCGRLCGRGAFHYYLLRKIDGKWQVIEDLGESSYIS